MSTTSLSGSPSKRPYASNEETGQSDVHLSSKTSKVERPPIFEEDDLPLHFNGVAQVNLTHGGVYIGEINRGIFNGNGSLISRTGAIFTGMFKKGKFNGEGTLVTASASVMKGTFTDNKLNGRVMTISPIGDLAVNANFKDDEPDYNDEFSKIDSAGSVYRGGISETTGQYSGKGILISGNNIIQGHWKEGQLTDDVVSMINPDGAIYRGAINPDTGTADGQGTKVNAEGSILSGKWKRDKFQNK